MQISNNTVVATAIGFAASLALLVAASVHLIEFGWIEALGFVSGGVCVWLAVRENVWNWPIGIANNAFYVAVFLQSRLYADMSLQIAFAVLGGLGWYFWLRPNGRSESLTVTRTPRREWLVLAILGILATVLWTRFLTTIGDASPFLDALTTASSLIAQYLLTRKHFENWWVWIATDVVSIGLYLSKGLVLTAILYAIFIAMCVAGLRRWSTARA